MSNTVSGILYLSFFLPAGYLRICDRGYPNYNLIAHMIRNGQHFLFRSQNAEGSIGGYWWEKLSGGMNTGSINVKVMLETTDFNQRDKIGGR